MNKPTKISLRKFTVIHLAICILLIIFGIKTGGINRCPESQVAGGILDPVGTDSQFDDSTSGNEQSASRSQFTPYIKAESPPQSPISPPIESLQTKLRRWEDTSSPKNLNSPPICKVAWLGKLTSTHETVKIELCREKTFNERDDGKFFLSKKGTDESSASRVYLAKSGCVVTEGLLKEGEEGDDEPGGQYCAFGTDVISIVSSGMETIFQGDPFQIKMQKSYHSQPAMGGRDAVREYDPHSETMVQSTSWSWDWTQKEGGGISDRILACKTGAHQDSSQFYIIPQILSDTSFQQEGWKKVPLGNCALSFGGSGKVGFLLAGKLEVPGQALKVLAINAHELVIDIDQTEFTTSSTNWLYSDHIEIWLEDVQWIVTLNDGKAFLAFGKTDQKLTVEKVFKRVPPIKLVTSLKLSFSLPFRSKRMSVSYSKGTGKEKVKYLISSSQICFGKKESLGFVLGFPPELVACSVNKGFLDFSLKNIFSLDLGEKSLLELLNPEIE